MKIIASPNDACEYGWSGVFGWFCIRTAPRREMAAAEDLVKELGIKAFVPVEIVKVRAGRGPSRVKVREIEKPFFPGYLFAQLDMDVDAYYRLKDRQYVVAVVCGSDRKPSPVPDAAMAHLINHGPFREPDPKPGDIVRLSTGPMAGLLTKIIKVDRGDRIKVLISFMGADRPIELKLSDIERMPDGYAAHREGIMSRAS